LVPILSDAYLHPFKKLSRLDRRSHMMMSLSQIPFPYPIFKNIILQPLMQAHRTFTMYSLIKDHSALSNPRSRQMIAYHFLPTTWMLLMKHGQLNGGYLAHRPNQNWPIGNLTIPTSSGTATVTLSSHSNASLMVHVTQHTLDISLILHSFVSMSPMSLCSNNSSRFPYQNPKQRSLYVTEG
jgi:hypothetical protein